MDKKLLCIEAQELVERISTKMWEASTNGRKEEYFRLELLYQRASERYARRYYNLTDNAT